MNKMVALLLAVTLLAGCGKNSAAIGIIGGADGPTSIIVNKEPLPSSSSSESQPEPESPPAVESSSSSTAESKSESKPESKPASSSSVAPPPASLADDEVDFVLSNSKVKAGDYLLLTGRNLPDDASVTLECSASGSRKFFQDGSDGNALIAVSRSATPSKQTLSVSWSGGKKVIPFEIVDAGFASQSFQMAEGTVNNTVNNEAARAEYNKITAEAMALTTAESDFPDPASFIMPIKQQTFKISSSYGFTRIVNGKVSGRHEGIDFPAPQGTPVVAAGGGKVLYSGLMQMTGNTVIIEHGMGLKSWYHHMNSLDCETGDILEAGDPVGKVGTTGYSTGNHLHFGMSVFDTYTNPWQFIPYPK